MWHQSIFRVFSSKKIYISMNLKDCHNHRVLFTYQKKKIFLIQNAVEESIHSIKLHDHMASRQKTMWSIGQKQFNVVSRCRNHVVNQQKPRGQSAETMMYLNDQHCPRQLWVSLPLVWYNYTSAHSYNCLNFGSQSLGL